MNISYSTNYKVALEIPYQSKCEALAEFLGCALILPEDIATCAQEKTYVLTYTENGLVLLDPSRKNVKPIVVNFVSGSANHRRLYGGGKGQMIAKAVGIKSTQFSPHILDATAGLGGDGFVLACLGSKVTLVERNPIAYSLLKDGLERAVNSLDDDLVAVINRMELVYSNSCEYIDQIQADCMPDVIYLDPMFPERKKSASVKKEMQFFHEIIGKDEDSEMLIHSAIEKATYRVAVKRPKIAGYLGNITPTTQLMGKASRFDIYTKKKMPTQNKN